MFGGVVLVVVNRAKIDFADFNLFCLAWIIRTGIVLTLLVALLFVVVVSFVVFRTALVVVLIILVVSFM